MRPDDNWETIKFQFTFKWRLISESAIKLWGCIKPNCHDINCFYFRKVNTIDAMQFDVVIREHWQIESLWRRKGGNQFRVVLIIYIMDTELFSHLLIAVSF